LNPALHDLVIRNGTLISPSRLLEGDLGVDQGKITRLGQGLRGRREIDAAGSYVLPGGVDPHVHLETPVGATRSSDDWFSGTRAAAFGGTTSVIDFVEPGPAETLEEALQARRRLACNQAVVDYGLHMTLTRADDETLTQVPALCRAGCSSFKTYLTYPGFRLSDPEMLRILTCVRTAGGIVLVHAENDAIIDHLQQQAREQPASTPRLHALTRPAIAEAEAIQRSLALAEVSGARLYIVHTSTALGVEAIQRARQRGVNVSAETCPQYLLLTEEALARPDFEGAKFVCSPPLRSPQDQERLWAGLANDDLQSIGTDHCPFNYHGQKDLGRDNFLDIPAGLPGIESRLALLHHFGVQAGRISLPRWVELCCSNPARIFGLYPQKGSLEPGADADLVIFDPTRRLRLGQATLHEQVDYSPYEGFELHGCPVTTLLRGQVIVENGEFLGAAGDGRYLPRPVSAG
jgi:dihydropyrimidinase